MITCKRIDKTFQFNELRGTELALSYDSKIITDIKTHLKVVIITYSGLGSDGRGLPTDTEDYDVSRVKSTCTRLIILQTFEKR